MPRRRRSPSLATPDPSAPAGRSPRRAGRSWPAATTAVVLVACSSPPSNGERFCGEIDANRDALFTPVVATAPDVDAVVDLYRSVAEVTPLAIEAEWDQLVVNYETASTVVPGDEASVQRAVRTALESETAAAVVVTWIRDNCGIDVGPIATLVPRD